MFGPPRTAGPFMPTVRGPIRIYGTVPVPVVSVRSPIPRHTFTQVASGYRGPTSLRAGPVLALGPNRRLPIVRSLYAVLAPSYRGPTRVNSPAPVPRVVTPQATPLFTGQRYDTTSGYVYAFPPQHPFGVVYPDYERWLLPVLPEKLILRSATNFNQPGL